MRTMRLVTALALAACAGGCAGTSASSSNGLQPSTMMIPDGVRGDTLNGVPVGTVSAQQANATGSAGFLNGAALPSGWGQPVTTFMDGVKGNTINGVNMAQQAVTKQGIPASAINLNGLLPQNWGGNGNIPGTH